MLDSNSNLGKVLTQIYKKTKLNYDYFGVVSGGEGIGKSRGIVLPTIDFWYKKLLKIKVPKFSISTDIKQFVKNLEKGKHSHLIALDEAGDALDTQEYNNRLNRALYQAYTIIRERKLFTLIALPSFFDLNPRFRKRRVKLLIHVYKRVNNICLKCKSEFVGPVCPCGHKKFKKGYICYKVFNKEKLQQILEKNVNRTIKSLEVGVKPVTMGITQEYNGSLKNFYKNLKDEKTEGALKKLKGIVDEINGVYACKHEFRFLRKSKAWYCRKCGFETVINPFGGGVNNSIEQEGGNDGEKGEE